MERFEKQDRLGGTELAEGDTKEKERFDKEEGRS